MKKFWYGILAFSPLIDFIVSVILMSLSIAFMVGAASGQLDMSAATAIILLWISIAGLILGVILCIVGAIVFSVHAKKNAALDSKAQGIWIGSLVTLVCFAFPVYWWKCIRKSN